MISMKISIVPCLYLIVKLTHLNCSNIPNRLVNDLKNARKVKIQTKLVM